MKIWETGRNGWICFLVSWMSLICHDNEVLPGIPQHGRDQLSNLFTWSCTSVFYFANVKTALTGRFHGIYVCVCVCVYIYIYIFINHTPNYIQFFWRPLLTHFVQPVGVKTLKSRKVTLKGREKKSYLVSAHIDQILEVWWLTTDQSQGQKWNVCVGIFSCG